MRIRRCATDREILRFIYKHYYSEFSQFEKEKGKRQTKIYIPIDCKLIADHFGIDRDIVFGRLYYHLEKKYGYKQEDGTNVYFFAFNLGKENKCINFPFMASVLSDMEESYSRFKWTVLMSACALVISIISLGFSATDKISSNISNSHPVIADTTSENSDDM